MRRAIALVLCTAAWVVAPGGTAVGAATPTSSRADEQVVTVPIIVPRYDSGMVPASTSSGFQEKCQAQTYIRFPEIHGYQADHIVYQFNGSRSFIGPMTPPYADTNQTGAANGGEFVLPAGMHQVLLEGIASVTNGPPWEDCADEQARYKAQYSPTAEVTYVRSEACVDAQDAVSSAKGKVKAAKKALNHATTAAEKRKAKKKLKKANKKLDKAEALADQAC